MRQKFDPFAVRDETHCGDCNKTLTSATEGRLESAYIYEGVRCGDCYREHVSKQTREKPIRSLK